MIRQFVSALESDLIEGNFENALQLLNRFDKDETLQNQLRRLSQKSGLKQRGAAAVAEVLAYQGRNPEARDWLAPWVDESGGVCLDEALPARARLQAVEYAYSLRQFEQAVFLGEKVLRQCEARGDLLGQAEAAYYLARSHMRRHRTVDVFCCTDLALQKLSVISKEQGFSCALQWRMGLLFLVGGFTSWQAGQDTARAKLLAARGLLARSRDVLAPAHVEHALGSVLRSMPTLDLAEALSAFITARDVYLKAKHPIHLARVLTNIGRTHFDAGDWAHARTTLYEALDTAREIRDELARRRQKAETLVYLSWLEAYGTPRDVGKGDERAREALAEADGVAAAMTVEALLAQGSCLLILKGHFNRVSESFERALREAQRLNIGKLKVHANLCLAQLYSTPERRDLGRAVEHWRNAEQMLSGLSSRYLREKADQVGRVIVDRQQLWMVTKGDVLDRTGGNKFKKFRKDLEAWMVDTLEEEKSLSLRDRARLSGITPSGYVKKRGDRLSMRGDFRKTP